MPIVIASGQTFTVNYDGRYIVGIYVTNEKEMLLVPILQSICCSNAVVLYKYPIVAETLGGKVLELFEQMDQHNLEFKETYKDFWLVPKGVRSWKQFERSTLTIDIRCIDGEFHLYRWHVAETRGFETDSEEPTLVVSRTISAQDLGTAILDMFEDMQKNPWTPPPQSEKRRRKKDT